MSGDPPNGGGQLTVVMSRQLEGPTLRAAVPANLEEKRAKVASGHCPGVESTARVSLFPEGFVVALLLAVESCGLLVGYLNSTLWCDGTFVAHL